MEPIDTDIGVDVDMEVEPATLDVEMCDSGGGHLVRLRTLMDVDPPEDDYSEEWQAVSKSRGYKCLYLPPYLPFLNPIEEFWAQVKSSMWRTALAADDILSDQICEAFSKK
ncbi:hypothetical protein EV175_000462 [Coemansia sp. RSA 1933]|nr:hypothetical protein EV175_000462 [Coemansia sp. RSA 1933]